MKKELYNYAMKLYNDLANMGVYTSYRSVLNTMYETASQKKQYEKCHIILELINDDIEEIEYSRF